MGSEVRLRQLPDYGVAAMATGLALDLQFMLIPWFGGDPNSRPFMKVLAAVPGASWLGSINQPPNIADRVY